MSREKGRGRRKANSTPDSNASVFLIHKRYSGSWRATRPPGLCPVRATHGNSVPHDFRVPFRDISRFLLRPPPLSELLIMLQGRNI